MDLKIFGVGGHSRVVFDVAKLNGISVSCFFDDNPLFHKTEFCGVKVIGPIVNFIDGNAIIAIGENKTRKSIFDRVSNALWQTLIHPSALISKDVMIGEGSIIMAGGIIQTGTKIGKHTIINTGACIDHDCHIGDFAHIAPNCSLSGGVLVGEGAKIGIGACVIPGVKIGKWATIGAGSVIIRDVPDYAVIVGNPGKVIKYNYEK